MIKKYRKKPLVIEAVQYTGDNHAEIKKFAKGGAEDYIFVDRSFYIATLEGDMKVSVNDFIIKGIIGEFYVCKGNVFFLTYDEVEEEAKNV